MVKLIIKEDYSGMSKEAFNIFRGSFDSAKVLGFATGSTPLGLYQLISEEAKSGRISFDGKLTFNLDEYCGVDSTDSSSFRYYMDQNLLLKAGIDPSRIHFPDSRIDPEVAARHYREEYLKYGPVDLQILGIGRNGHIAFNEPGSALESVTRVVELSEDTLDANRPKSRKAITMGVKEILESKKILLLASGKDKSMALMRALRGAPNSSVPASFLQMHGDVTFVLDEEAASMLEA